MQSIGSCVDEILETRLSMYRDGQTIVSTCTEMVRLVKNNPTEF